VSNYNTVLELLSVLIKAYSVAYHTTVSEIASTVRGPIRRESVTAFLNSKRSMAQK